MKIEITDQPNADDEAFVIAQTRAYNAAFVERDVKSLCVFMRDAEENIIGGLTGKTYWRYLDVSFLWVHPKHRAKGYGRTLYQHFFESVMALGCTEVHCITSPVNTGSIAFHRRVGFGLLEGDGTVDGVPVSLNHGGEGQHRVLFRKRLVPQVQRT